MNEDFSLEIVSSAYLRLQKDTVTRDILHSLSTPDCDLTKGTSITLSLDGTNTSWIDLSYEDLQGSSIPPINIMDLLEADKISDVLTVELLLELDDDCLDISLDSLGLTSAPVLSVYTKKTKKHPSLFDYLDMKPVNRVKRRVETNEACTLQKFEVSMNRHNKL